jgi:hypothetical protein
MAKLQLSTQPIVMKPTKVKAQRGVRFKQIQGSAERRGRITKRGEKKTNEKRV